MVAIFENSEMHRFHCTSFTALIHYRLYSVCVIRSVAMFESSELATALSPLYQLHFGSCFAEMVQV